MPNIGPLTWYCRDNSPTSTIGWSAVQPWAASTAVAAGVLRRQLATPAVNNERVFVCIVAGTTGSSEPGWTVTKGAKTTDNTVTWQECTGQPGVNGDLPVSISVNASSITTTSVVTLLVSSTTGVQVGMYVTEPVPKTYLPTGGVSCVVTAIVPNTSITLGVVGAANTTIPASTSFWFGHSPFWLTQVGANPTLGYLIYDQVTASLQICTTAGSLSTLQPSFSSTAGVTTTDNTNTWTSLGPASNFGAWAAPHARLQNAWITNFATAGSTVWVGDDHAETQTTTISINTAGTGANPCYVYCGDHTASLPLGTGNLKTTASVLLNSTTVPLALYGYWHMYGMIFQSTGTTGNTLTILASNAGMMRLDNCSLQLTAGSGTAKLQLGAVSGQSELILNNTPVSFSAVGQSIVLSNIRLVWKNTAPATIGSVPTTLFSASSECVIANLDGLDLSAVNTTLFANQTGPLYCALSDCKLASGFTIATAQSGGGAIIDVIRSDSAATIYQAQRYDYRGVQVPELVVIRTGGASDGVTSVSNKISTTANSFWLTPYEAFPIAIWNAVTGSTVHVTICGIWSSASLPNNDQIWMDVEYLGSSATPIATFASGTKANNLALGTALSADTSAWDSQATSWAASTAYAVGTVIKVSSNPGQLFFCTTAGTTSATLSGYSGTADGGSVTDNTAVFRAGVRFKFVATLSSPTPAMVGDLYATIRVALPSSTFWVDPLITLS